MRRREDLTAPWGSRRFGIHYDPEAFGNFSEGIARFLGTGRYLAGQTVLVIIWIIVNVAFITLRWDPYPFILLNLAFSTQAAYAAPLILLAQNRQEARDRVQEEQDRQASSRTQADTEFLAREVASIRLTLSDVVTTDDLEKQLELLVRAVDQLAARLEGSPPPATPA